MSWDESTVFRDEARTFLYIRLVTCTMEDLENRLPQIVFVCRQSVRCTQRKNAVTNYDLVRLTRTLDARVRDQAP
jgi:hypothetical protein